MKAEIEKAAEEYSEQDHEWHSCNAISLAPVRRNSFLAGYSLAEKEIEHLELMLNIEKVLTDSIAKDADKLQAKVELLKGVLDGLKKLKRYEFMLTGMYQRPDGRFVAYEDVNEALEKVKS